MNKNQVIDLLTAIKVLYPNFKQENLDVAVKMWGMVFRDYTFEDAMKGLDAYTRLENSAFAPSASQIIAYIEKPNKMSGEEAWELVLKGLRNSGYHSQEEFDKLPASVQQAIVSPAKMHDLCLMDMDILQKTERWEFIRRYNQISERMMIGQNTQGQIGQHE